MNILEVANQLVDYCRKGDYTSAQESLYAEDVVSIEPEGTPAPRVQGMDAIREKAKMWEEGVEEMHGAEVSDPIVAGNHFSIKMVNDVTFKGMGRQKIEEIAVYEVTDGKITKEQFFYEPQPMG